MAKLIQVKRKPNEPIEKLIKRWKRKFEDAEVKDELIRRKEYIKPSLLRRRMKDEAIRQNKKDVKLYKKENGIR